MADVLDQLSDIANSTLYTEHVRQVAKAAYEYAQSLNRQISQMQSGIREMTIHLNRYREAAAKEKRTGAGDDIA